MTLIELLVVVTILFVVAAMMVPRLPAMMDHARIREAARALQLYFSTARNQAMSSGRSCGVMIEPLAAENGCAMTLSAVETPPPYGGDSLASTATVTPYGGTGMTSLGILQPSTSERYAVAQISFSSWPSVALFAGDSIQLNYQGLSLTVGPLVFKGVPMNTFDAKQAVQSISAAAGPSLIAFIDISCGEQPAFLTPPGMVVPYKIVRWPTKSAAGALQIPSPTVIDLTASGCDPISGNPAIWPGSTPTTPPTIMFASDGTVDCTYVQTAGGGYNKAIPTTPIYLLVGLRNKVKPSNPKDANINDYNSLWIAINPSTGLITVADLASLPANPATGVTDPDLFQSRAFARQASANGGK